MNRNPLRPSSTVRASVGDDGLVLLDLRGGLVLSANAVGGRIWKLIEQRRSRDDIAGQLVADFAVDRDRAARDVDRFVTDLLARGLVTEDAH
ncbi:MAG TPA: PqqD family protein [Vicinamibacterales bacterium]